MSYYGGSYSSFASYSSYGASTNYSYSNSYNADNCYSTGSYLNQYSNYISEVRYGSYASQCANWQNTATTIMLWHLLFPAENAAGWQHDGETLEITLELDEAEEVLDCFVEGVLAFLEQIGGRLCDNTQGVEITLPAHITTVSEDFYHGMLAFLIEIYGAQSVRERVLVHSPHGAPCEVFAAFWDNVEQVADRNKQKVAVIKDAISRTNDLHDTNEQFIRDNRESAKRTAIASLVVGIPAFAGSFVMQNRGMDTWVNIAIAVSIVAAFVLVYSLVQMIPTHKLQKKTLDGMADMSSVIEQLHALEK
jgi:hypothetical protein